MDIKKQQALGLLKIHYGYDAFRPGQDQAIENVLNGKSTIVIMPTGGGKSLCYQLPALLLEGATIVISPLISLMKDQVDSLEKIGIPATFINSSITPEASQARLDAVKNGTYKLLYIAPERFYSPEFMATLKEIKISLVAIDEAHCISQWGHDFRPSYLRVKDAIKELGSPIVIALTATATPEVKEDIIKQLDLINPEVIITGFARPNLQFAAIQASDSTKPDIVLRAIMSAPEGSGIIYASTRSRSDDVLAMLLANGVEAAAYHAGMDANDRQWVQENFMSNKVKVIVATNAFGLGIDKRNIRFVIHYDMPGTIEAYYQEAGRAGRDGQESFCLLLYSSRDRFLQEFFIKGDNPPPEMVLEIYEVLKSYETDKILITYAEIGEILSEKLPDMAIGTAIKILEREGYITKSREKNGLAFLKTLVSLGDINKTFTSRQKKQQDLIEKLFNHLGASLNTGLEINLEEIAQVIGTKKDSLQRLIRKLVDANLMEYKPPFKGSEINILKRVPKHEVKIDFTALKEKHRKAHGKLDEMENYVYHFGCRQEYILKYFGEYNAHSCKKCDNCLGGFSDRQQPTRQPIKKVFKEYLDLETKPGTEIEIAPQGNSGLNTKLTQLETLELYTKGLTIEEMSIARQLATDTIVDHLCFLIKKKIIKAKIDDFLDQHKQRVIKKAIEKVGAEKLKTVKDETGEDIGYEDIKLFLAFPK